MIAQKSFPFLRVSKTRNSFKQSFFLPNMKPINQIYCFNFSVPRPGNISKEDDRRAQSLTNANERSVQLRVWITP